MFSHDSAYRHNRFERNGAGVAVMYSRNVEMTSNHFAYNWGSASYGLLLKDMTDGRITGNTFDHNTSAIAMHGSNRMTIERNDFSENGWAIQVQSSQLRQHLSAITISPAIPSTSPPTANSTTTASITTTGTNTKATT